MVMWPSVQALLAALAAASPRLAAASTWPPGVAANLTPPATTPWPNASSISAAMGRAAGR